jgi:hypothetical protein
MAGDVVILPVTRGDRGGAAVLAGSRERGAPRRPFGGFWEEGRGGVRRGSGWRGPFIGRGGQR